MIKFALFFVLLFAPLSGLTDNSDQVGTSSVDPAVSILIEELGLRESADAVRDMPGWSVPKKIVVREGRPGTLEAYQSLAPDVDFVMVESVEQARIEAVDAQAVLGYCDEEMLAGSPGLFWVQVYAAGVERCVANPAIHKGNRLLTNGQRIGSPAA